ncbi:MAG TPA: nicotinamide riboside transporter PnuC [Candidatus Acidoferrum sp.]|nr:nicotinamide riboside transporter PnuC [Candidatus Acidoferrum sp.]
MMSPLEIAAVLTSVLGIWLSTRRKLSSWPVILVSCILYALVFRREKLYSDMLLQFVYFAFAIYGWWHWWHGVKEEGIVRVERLSGRGLAAGLVVGAVGSFLLGFLMARYTDAALPHIDAALTSYSLVAQWWSTRKHIANWWLWIVVDALEIGVFLYKRLYLTSVLFAFLIFLAVLGLRAWNKALREQESGSRDPMVVANSNLAAPESNPS